MKKINLITLIIFIAYSNVYSQSSKTFALRRLEMTYGIMNLEKLVIGKILDFGSTPYSTNSFNEVSLRAQLNHEDSRFRIKPNFRYSSIHFNSNFVDTVSGFVPKKVNESLKLKSFTFQIDFEHQINHSKKSELYYIIGIGTTFKQIKKQTNSEIQTVYDDIEFKKNPTSLALNFRIGYRYFITDHIAINSEVGIMTSPLNVGITYKFN